MSERIARVREWARHCNPYSVPAEDIQHLIAEFDRLNAAVSGETATLESIARGIETIMQNIQDFAAAVRENFAKVKLGIQALDDKITAFQNSPGTLSAADQAALDDIQAQSVALAAAAQAIVPPVAPAAPLAPVGTATPLVPGTTGTATFPSK